MAYYNLTADRSMGSAKDRSNAKRDMLKDQNAQRRAERQNQDQDCVIS